MLGGARSLRLGHYATLSGSRRASPQRADGSSSSSNRGVSWGALRASSPRPSAACRASVHVRSPSFAQRRGARELRPHAGPFGRSREIHHGRADVGTPRSTNSVGACTSAPRGLDPLPALCSVLQPRALRRALLGGTSFRSRLSAKRPAVRGNGEQPAGRGEQHACDEPSRALSGFSASGGVRGERGGQIIHPGQRIRAALDSQEAHWPRIGCDDPTLLSRGCLSAPPSVDIATNS